MTEPYWPLEEPTESSNRQSRMLRIRAAAAERAEKMADEAEAYAAYLERSAVREGTDQRLLLARRERDIAAVERRNALKLRQAGTRPIRLEGLPRLTSEAGQGGA
jgi:hypothetical protein